MVYQVKDLSPDQKLAVESLLGRAVSEGESVSIKAIVSPDVIPSKLSHAERVAALQQLNDYFKRVDEKRQPMSDEEEDALVTEAIRSVRPSYRPIG